MEVVLFVLDVTTDSTAVHLCESDGTKAAKKNEDIARELGKAIKNAWAAGVVVHMILHGCHSHRLIPFIVKETSVVQQGQAYVCTTTDVFPGGMNSLLILAYSACRAKDMAEMQIKAKAYLKEWQALCDQFEVLGTESDSAKPLHERVMFGSLDTIAQNIKSGER